MYLRTTLRHFHLLWNRDVLELNNFDSNLTVSKKLSSQVFLVRYNLRTCIPRFLAFVELADIFCISPIDTVGNIDIFISSVICLKGLILIWCVGKCFECVPHCILSENCSTICRADYYLDF